ncbi:MAG: type II secretion system minor pseudopilin GspJ [Gammaproteobacteria bacterium]|nr:type II secretion system minor pseudopilin GspJ [Gammaproteobacteria bacterium]
MMHRVEQHTQGFTLLELLIAIAIFALLSLTAYSGLDSAIKQKRVGEAQAETLRRIQISLLHMERDLQQAVNRGSRYGLTEEGALEYTSLAPAHLKLTRTGRSNPLGRPRGHLQRIGYMLKGGELIRLTWLQLDSLAGEEPQQGILLDEVEGWTIRLMDSHQQWHESWPQRDPSGQVVEPLPAAVEMTLTLKGWGEIRRLIKMVGS